MTSQPVISQPATTPTVTSQPRTSQPAHRALGHAGVTTLEELSEWRRADVAALHGMGPKALGLLDVALRGAGLDWTA